MEGILRNSFDQLSVRNFLLLFATALVICGCDFEEAVHKGTHKAVQSCIDKNQTANTDVEKIKTLCVLKHEQALDESTSEILTGSAGYNCEGPCCNLSSLSPTTVDGKNSDKKKSYVSYQEMMCGSQAEDQLEKFQTDSKVVFEATLKNTSKRFIVTSVGLAFYHHDAPDKETLRRLGDLWLQPGEARTFTLGLDDSDFSPPKERQGEDFFSWTTYDVRGIEIEVN